MLTGYVPRDFPVGCDPLRVVLQQEVVPIQERGVAIPERLANVINRAVNDNQGQRYQTATEFRTALLCLGV